MLSLKLRVARSDFSKAFWNLIGHSPLAQFRDLVNQRKFFYNQKYDLNSVTANTFLEELSKPGGNLKFIYRNRVLGPTYGDFLCVLFLARLCEVVSSSSCEFFIDDRSRHKNWNLLTDLQQSEFLANQLELGKRYLVGKVELLKSDFEKDETIEVYSSSGPIMLNRPLYQIAGDLTSRIYRQFGQGVSDDFLLLPKKMSEKEPFLSWGIRLGNWDERRNSKEFEILSDYKFIRKFFPHTHIRVFSTQGGWDLVERTLVGHYKVAARELLVQKQESEDFIGASEEILFSLLHFQRNGGGIGVIPLYSRLPYVIFSPDINYFPARRLAHIVPWASKHQLFFIVRYGSKLYYPNLRLFILRIPEIFSLKKRRVENKHD